jgi:hypothetical protein
MQDQQNNQVEDIFETVEKRSQPAQPQRPASMSEFSVKEEVSYGPSPQKKILFGVGLFVLVSFLIGFIVVMIIRFGIFDSEIDVMPTVLTEEELLPVEEEIIEEEVVSVQDQPGIDSDRDGLSDEEEKVLKTNINKYDTDKDGLSDYDEVKIYGTDPVKADSDGDGYLDGDEMKNGYNPLGDGQLLNFQESLKKLKQNQ